jgi:hypothetical protein
MKAVKFPENRPGEVAAGETRRASLMFVTKLSYTEGE